MSFCKILSRIKHRTADARGQSSVEAAALLLTLLLLLGILVQPVCMAYTQTIMHHAAAEALRVAATTKDDEVVRSFVLRRLGAVPEASLFHVGGRTDWNVQIERSSDAKRATVRIEGHLRPLPLVGAVTTIACERDATGVRLSQSVTEGIKPPWLEGDYESWMSCW